MTRIQLCAGGNQLAGWENRDIDCDLTKLPLPYPDNHADIVMIEHGLEHFNSHQALFILDDIWRILKPGGKIRVCCPVLDRLNPSESRSIILDHGHELFFSAESLVSFIKAAGFSFVTKVPRSNVDGHWKVIGKELDDKETIRIEGNK